MRILIVDDDLASAESLTALLTATGHHVRVEVGARAGADAVVLMTEWNQYRALDMAQIRAGMNNPPVFVDLRNVYDPERMKAEGFRYTGVGRK